MTGVPLTWEQMHERGWRCVRHWPLVAGVSRRLIGNRKKRVEWQWHISRGYDFLLGGKHRDKAQAFAAAEAALSRFVQAEAPPAEKDFQTATGITRYEANFIDELSDPWALDHDEGRV